MHSIFINTNSPHIIVMWDACVCMRIMCQCTYYIKLSTSRISISGQLHVHEFVPCDIYLILQYVLSVSKERIIHIVITRLFIVHNVIHFKGNMLRHSEPVFYRFSHNICCELGSVARTDIWTRKHKVRQSDNKVRQSDNKVRQSDNKVRQSDNKVRQSENKVRQSDNICSGALYSDMHIFLYSSLRM